jgi:hypothetical protein
MPTRRYEMLLPLKHNDGTPINPEKHLQTCDDIAARFGGYSLLPQAVQGVWLHQGERFADETLRLITDAADTPETRQFFAEFKLLLRDRFEQIEVYIVSYPIEVV